MALKIQLDTENKTIKLMESTSVETLLTLLPELLKDYKDYTILPVETVYQSIPYQYPQIENPFKPPYYPQVWYTNCPNPSGGPG